MLAPLTSSLLLSQVSGEGLEAVVRFCYTGIVEAVTGENAAALLHASQRLQVGAMSEALIKWLTANLNAQSVLVVFEMADKLQLEALRQHACAHVHSIGGAHGRRTIPA